MADPQQPPQADSASPAGAADAQAEADRGARKKIVRSWCFALAALAYVAFRVWVRARGSASPAAAAKIGPHAFVPYCVGGALLLLIATALSHGFTFRFDKPVWRAMNLRLIAVQVAATAGFTVSSFPYLDVMNAWLGISGGLAGYSFFAVALGVTLPLLALFRVVQRAAMVRRVRAQGPGADPLQRGFLVTFKSLEGGGPYEAGLLWIDGQELRFVGDELAFTLHPRTQLQAAREIIVGTLAGMLGRRGLAITIPFESGPVRTSVSMMGLALPGAQSASLGRLAEQLATWQRG